MIKKSMVLLSAVLLDLLGIFLCGFIPSSVQTQPPNLIFILADDLGWDDVGFHGSEIKTPNIDRLAKEGIVLNNYYVQQVCTPTRSAILTGKYPIHTGLQSGVPMGTEPYGLPLDVTTLPQKLKDFGYDTHAIGKWHLGFCSEGYLPENRGFDSFLGFYQGHSDYFDHHFHFRDMIGLDFHFKKQPLWNYSEIYSTEIFTNRAKSIIQSHNKSKPLYIYMPHQGVHAADYDVIQAPQKYIDRFPYITDIRRKYFAGAVSALDDSVGIVYQALVDAGMADNTVIVFSTDNGGPTNGREKNAACNWPLRGSKQTLWQGGVHGVGFVHSPLLQKKGYVSEHLIHAVDWFSTFLSLATRYSSMSSTDPQNKTDSVDGIDQWDALSMNVPTRRKEVLINIDPIKKTEAIVIGDFKLTKGEMDGGKYDGWYPPPHHKPSEKSGQGQRKGMAKEMKIEKPSSQDIGNIESLETDLDELIVWMNLKYEKLKVKGALLFESEKSGPSLTVLSSEGEPVDYVSERSNYESSGMVKIDCGRKPANASTNCNLRKEACLFNLKQDPCEYMNLNDLMPEVVEKLQGRINFYRKNMVYPINKGPDPKGDPALHGGVWVPWL